jgi:opacity protein-like surface antigen
VHIKRSILALLCFAFSSVALVSAHGQVVPSATERVFTVRAGAFASAFQPDYTNEGAAITGPYRVYGVGGYVDAHFSRWIQPELEVRFLRFNEYNNVDENTYSLGERVPIKTFHKFTPYGKVLAGLGDASWLSGTAFVLTYGGGVDYRLNRKFTIRCADFEFQQWPVTSVNPQGVSTSFTIRPYGLNAGLSYRIF